MMTFEEILQQTIDILQSRGRVSYRALKRQFDLDDDYLDDLKEELHYAYPQVVDEDGRGLTWTGEMAAASAIPTAPSPTAGREPVREPHVYTPPHLIEKILTSHAVLEGERKQVTVLFCDLANSTGLAEQLGAETMHTVLNQFFELALGAVHRYEGTINQFLGDGFMALFGAPIAHEDHARRAVLAALELRHELQTYNTGQAQQYGVELTIRTGLNTGLVVVGAIGNNLRMDYTAVGDTTNVAARLEHEAAPDQVVISEETYRLVAGYCTTRELGAFSVRGKAEPVRAWEVSDVHSTRTRFDVAVERGLTPFMGRARELQTLHDCFAQAQAGHGQVVFLVGEAGIGKSRLLLECRQQLDGTDATWLEGRALSFGQSMVFHPLIDLLKRNFRIEEGDAEAAIIAKIEQRVLALGEDLRPLLPYLRYLLAVDPGDATVQQMEAQLRRAELFESLRRLLVRAAEIRPQVLVLEDLHWMDQATEDFLRTIADTIPTSRVLCLFTYRPGYVHPFGERTYHTRMALPTLSVTDSIHMAQAILETGRLPTELEALIVQKAEGNPFFVEEVVKSLQEVGAMKRVGDQYALTKPLEEIVVPDTIQDVLMARIDRLEEAPKYALQLAAVIGREFTYRLLDRLADFREPTEGYLQELKAIELIYQKGLYPELAYMFKHALTQDVAYNSLLIQRRKDLHRLIGCAIEELYVDRLVEHYEVLAYHFTQGEAWAKALDYLCKAANKAAQAFATRDAVALYDQALEMTDRLGQEVEAQTVMAIHQAKVDLYLILSEFEKARVEATVLLSRVREVGDRTREGAVLATIALVSMMRHNFDQALDEAHQAIEIAEEVDTQQVLARGYFTIGWVQQVRGQLDQADQTFERCLSLSQSVGDIVPQAFPLIISGVIKRMAGEYVAALHLLTEGVRIAREHTLLMPLLNGLFVSGITLTDKGDYDEARALFEEGLALSEKVGDVVWGNRLLNGFGWLCLECGELDRALDLNRRSAEGARRRNEPEVFANAEVNLGDTLLARGEIALAQECFDGVYRVVSDPATSDWNRWRYSMRLFASLGELWLVRGNDAKVQEYVDQCLEIATCTNSRKYIVIGWRLKGQIACARRQWDEADGWLRQALPLAQTVGNPTQLWKTHLALGQLHTAMKRPERAQQAYHEAREVIDHLKENLRHPGLRASLESSSPIQQIYDLSASS